MSEQRVTPQAAANLFVLMRGRRAYQTDDAKVLGEIITMYAEAAYHLAIEEAKKEYREFQKGGCRLLSQGEDCVCMLCRLDRLHNLLRSDPNRVQCTMPQSPGREGRVLEL